MDSAEIKQLELIACRGRLLALEAVHRAASGHPGGSLSVMDALTVLYFHTMVIDPSKPDDPDRDRFVLSKGHCSPALYSVLAMRGYFPEEDLKLFRSISGHMSGHPDMRSVRGVDMSTGSLGQGISAAVGMAIAGKLDGKDYRVYAALGDGEIEEGEAWEAALSAAKYQLDNLCAFIDVNRLQIDGSTDDVMPTEPLDEKFTAFNWNVIRADGHDLRALAGAFDVAASVKGKPTVILLDTVKGKGVSFMENEAGWHGKAPDDEQMERARAELTARIDGLRSELEAMGISPVPFRSAGTVGQAGARLDEAISALRGSDPHTTDPAAGSIPGAGDIAAWTADASSDAAQNAALSSPAVIEKTATREAFGKTLAALSGTETDLVVLDADLAGATKSGLFRDACPERFLDMGIAEQNMVGVSAGLAACGKKPFCCSFAMFASGRAFEQVRNLVAYPRLNVKVIGSHGGLSVGEDGATHQCIEDFSLMRSIPGMSVLAPCDASEMRAAVRALLAYDGPAYMRLGRSAVETVTDYDSGRLTFEIGRGQTLADGKDVTLIATGLMVQMALKAARILADEGISARVLDLHTIKPLDEELVLKAARETGAIVTSEEHNIIGGLGSAVSEYLSGVCPVPVVRHGVNDEFGRSGKAAEVLEYYGLTPERMVECARQAIAMKA